MHSQAAAITALTALALWACATTGAVPVGETFSLGVGEAASVDGQDLDLTFAGVSRDNRCPKGVQCIVAGAATVVLEVDTAEEAGIELTLDVPPGGSASSQLEHYRITVLEVEPGAKVGRRIEPDEYVVTIRVEETRGESALIRQR